VLGTVIVGLVGAMFWLYRREKHQRRLKEHYEEQISQSAAYRRNIASTVSLMASEELEELHSKSSET
jgi:predicted histidine transporter YuiF (NhaC family)